MMYINKIRESRSHILFNTEDWLIGDVYLAVCGLNIAADNRSNYLSEYVKFATITDAPEYELCELCKKEAA